MKNTFILFALSCIVFACTGNSSGSQVGQFTTIDVEREYDMGEVAKGEMVETDIKITNTGDYPLVIADVKPDCSCTVSDFDEDPIQPGESTIIKANINTDQTGKGKVTKSVTITANTRPSSTIIKISAYVIG